MLAMQFGIVPAIYNIPVLLLLYNNIIINNSVGPPKKEVRATKSHDNIIHCNPYLTCWPAFPPPLALATCMCLKFITNKGSKRLNVIKFAVAGSTA